MDTKSFKKELKKAYKVKPAKKAAEIQPSISPEFLDILSEIAFDTLMPALEKIQAPTDVKMLAHSMYHLMVYLNNKEADKEVVGNAIMEAVNSIGNLGGIFYANSGNTTPRKGSLLFKENNI